MSSYMYFTSTLFLLAVLVVVYVVLSKHRLAILVSAALSLPVCLIGLLYVPEYWSPVRIIDMPVGIEDMMFCFTMGGLLWASAVGPLRCPLSIHLRARVLLSRYILCMAGAVALTLTLVIGVGMTAMGAFFVTAPTVGLVLMVCRPRLWPLAVVGPLVLTGPYLLFSAAVFALAPAYLQQWTLESLWGISILGVPVEEPLWCAISASVGPLVLGYAMDARLGEADAPAESRSRAVLLHRVVLEDGDAQYFPPEP